MACVSICCSILSRLFRHLPVASSRCTRRDLSCCSLVSLIPDVASAAKPDPSPPFQTFASCFNGGAPGSIGTRRCSTYRSSTGNSTLSCPAQFVDYRFAFYGNNGKGSRHVPFRTRLGHTSAWNICEAVIGKKCLLGGMGAAVLAAALCGMRCVCTTRYYRLSLLRWLYQVAFVPCHSNMQFTQCSLT
jgi:hypothetical protein